jgi:hypothetical protein
MVHGRTTRQNRAAPRPLAFVLSKVARQNFTANIKRFFHGPVAPAPLDLETVLVRNLYHDIRG